MMLTTQFVRQLKPLREYVSDEQQHHSGDPVDNSIETRAHHRHAARHIIFDCAHAHTGVLEPEFRKHFRYYF